MVVGKSHHSGMLMDLNLNCSLNLVSGAKSWGFWQFTFIVNRIFSLLVYCSPALESWWKLRQVLHLENYMMGTFTTRTKYFCFESTFLSDSVCKIFLFGELIFGLRNDSSFLLNSHLGLRKAGVFSSLLLIGSRVPSWCLVLNRRWPQFRILSVLILH